MDLNLSKVDFISKHFERMSSYLITASVFSYHATNASVNSSVLKYSNTIRVRELELCNKLTTGFS